MFHAAGTGEEAWSVAGVGFGGEHDGAVEEGVEGGVVGDLLDVDLHGEGYGEGVAGFPFAGEGGVAVCVGLRFDGFVVEGDLEGVGGPGWAADF